jgi:hypothetical protein
MDDGRIGAVDKFLDNCITLGTIRYGISAFTLYAKYSEWSKDNELDTTESPLKFDLAVQEYGIGKRMTNNGPIYMGIYF